MSIAGLVVEYYPATVETRVRFPGDAHFFFSFSLQHTHECHGPSRPLSLTNSTCLHLSRPDLWQRWRTRPEGRRLHCAARCGGVPPFSAFFRRQAGGEARSHSQRPAFVQAEAEQPAHRGPECGKEGCAPRSPRGGLYGACQAPFRGKPVCRAITRAVADAARAGICHSRRQRPAARRACAWSPSSASSS